MNLNLISNDNVNFPIPMANLLLDIAAGEDTGAQAAEVHLLLAGQVESAPEAAEALLIAVFHQLFRAVCTGSDTPEEKRGRLEGHYNAIFTGLGFTPFADLMAALDGFARWREGDSPNYEEADGLYALSSRLESSLLRYAIQRGILNLLMNSSAFLKRISLCRSLIADLEKADAATLETASHMGADYYFYEGWENE